jgi:hypothetical protein
MIILLGIDEHRPVTLLEGNYRFIASLLAGGQGLLKNARWLFSLPRWKGCCSYKTNFLTLARCLKNRIQHYWDRDTDLDLWSPRKPEETGPAALPAVLLP